MGGRPPGNTGCCRLLPPGSPSLRPDLTVSLSLRIPLPHFGLHPDFSCRLQPSAGTARLSFRPTARCMRLGSWSFSPAWPEWRPGSAGQPVAGPHIAHSVGKEAASRTGERHLGPATCRPGVLIKRTRMALWEEPEKQGIVEAACGGVSLSSFSSRKRKNGGPGAIGGESGSEHCRHPGLKLSRWPRSVL